LRVRAVGEDVIFACQHARAVKACEPLLARVAPDGGVRWLSTPYSHAIDFDGDPDACPPDHRVPHDWVHAYFRAGALTVSGDAIFAPYCDMPRTGWGLGYIIDLANGVLRSTAKTMAHNEATAMDGGGFLVGCGHQTTLYDAVGRQQAHWDTSGMHVIRRGDIRVLEMGPRGSRIARLLPNGSVVRGDLIDGFETSRPYIQDDGTIIFVRNGMVTQVQDLAIVERQDIDGAGEADIMSTRVLPVADGLVTTYARYVRNARGEVDFPIRHISGLVRIEF
jgi:hypothetical protein